MNISAASKAAGLPVKTVRYYADIGLVDAPSRSDAGYRSYDDAAVRKLIFARRSREFGFSIEECRELLGLYQDQDRTSSEVKRTLSPTSSRRATGSNFLSGSGPKHLHKEVLCTLNANKTR